MCKKLFLLSIFFLVASCGIPEEEGFKYTLEGQQYRQMKYRSITNGELWYFHTGIRTLKFDPGTYQNDFSQYKEVSLGIQCYGGFKGSFTYVSRSEFLANINNSEGEETPTNPYYDIFEPWDGIPDEPEDESEEEIAEVAEYYVVAGITVNSVTSGCSFPVESIQYLHLKLFQNGDLVLRDYNREIEFLFRPSN